MKYAVEAWAPDYGAPTDEIAMGQSDAPVDAAVEVPLGDWAPRTPDPAGPRPSVVLFVDGVRRVEARLWVTTDSGEVRQGICASWGAGVVRCDGRAELVDAQVRRGLFCNGDGLIAIDTSCGSFEPRPVSSDPAIALQDQMGMLEGRVATEAGAVGADLVVVDGPLGDRRRVPNAVGYIKTHQVAYLPDEVRNVVALLGAGQRTPLFVTGARNERYSWYLRLPGPGTHAWAGVVRCEVPADLPRERAIALADQVSLTLPAYASQPHKDPRAPQNLHPIAGLERAVRHRLGDAQLILRSLVVASSA
jgi:hypothetical protein